MKAEEVAADEEVAAGEEVATGEEVAGNNGDRASIAMIRTHSRLLSDLSTFIEDTNFQRIELHILSLLLL